MDRFLGEQHGASDPRNRNVPGDGKFDQSDLPWDVSGTRMPSTPNCRLAGLISPTFLLLP